MGDQAVGAVEDRLACGARLPAEEGAGLLGTVPIAAAQRGGDLAERGVLEPGREADREVRDPTRLDLTATFAQPVAQDAGHVGHPEELAGGEEALTGRDRRRHRQDVRIDQVTDVDDLQTDARRSGHLPRDHAGDDPHRPEVVGGEHGAEHGAGKHGRQLGGTVVVLHVVPGGALRERLGTAVRDQRRVVRVGPQGLVGDALGGVRRRARRVRRRRHHHAPYARSGRRPQDAQGAVARRGDEGLRVIGGGAQRGGDVQDVIDALHRRVPAVVRSEVGDRETEAPRRVDLGGDGLGDETLSLRAAHRGPYVVSAVQQLGDAPSGDVAASAGDQYQFGHGNPPWNGGGTRRCARMKRRALRYVLQRNGGPSVSQLAWPRGLPARPHGTAETAQRTGTTEAVRPTRHDGIGMIGSRT